MSMKLGGNGTVPALKGSGTVTVICTESVGPVIVAYTEREWYCHLHRQELALSLSLKLSLRGNGTVNET